MTTRRVAPKRTASTRAKATFAIVFILCAAHSTDVSAQPDDRIEAARRHVVDADEAYARKDFELALEHLHDADHIEPSPLLHCNIGRVLVDLGRNAEALDEYEFVLEHADDADAKCRPARPEISRLEPLVGVIVLEPTDVGTTIHVDGRERVVTPRGLRVDPGTRTVGISRPGYEPYRRQVVVGKGETVHFKLELVPLRSSGVVPSTAVRSDNGFLAEHQLSIGLGAAAIAAGALGVGLGIWTHRDYSDLAQTCAYTTDGCSQHRIDTVERKALATNITFGIAATTAASAAIAYLIESRRAEKRPASVTVVPAGRGAAIRVIF
jgi:hypothetical protein